LTFPASNRHTRTGPSPCTTCCFESGAGDFANNLGPSTCGKSTLLSLASSFEVPSFVYLRIAPSPAGYVVHDRTLLSWRSVRREPGWLLPACSANSTAAWTTTARCAVGHDTPCDTATSD
jgi:ABC-type nitrate/sulfonate/bicarbonate transport system ATPase subunit